MTDLQGDRAAIQIDSDVNRVLQFMERNVAAGKLLPVAEAVCALAAILWRDPCPLQVGSVLSLNQFGHEQLSVATQSHPEQGCAGDGSGAAKDSR